MLNPSNRCGLQKQWKSCRLQGFQSNSQPVSVSWFSGFKAGSIQCGNRWAFPAMGSLSQASSSSSSMPSVSGGFEHCHPATKAGLHNLSFSCGCALMNFQASEVQGLGPIWAKDIWPFFSSTIFSSLNHLFSFLCKAFSTDRWAVLQEIGTHLVTFFGLYLKLLQTPELFRPNHISAIFDLGVELGYQLDLLGSQHRITHDLPG